MNCAQTSHSTGQATQATRQADQENRGLALSTGGILMSSIASSSVFFLFLSWPKLLPQRIAPGPVELDRPAWALTFEPCSILGIHQHPSASWASGVSSSSQCHVFRLVIVTILDVSSLNSIAIGILFHISFLINCHLIILTVKTVNLMEMLKN